MKNLLHPLLISLMKKTTKMSLRVLNEKPQTEGAAIYVMNHSCRYDMPMEIWIDHAEKYGLEKRADIPEHYWEDFVEGLTKEWPGYKMQDNVEQQFQNKAFLEQAQVERDLLRVGGSNA